MTNKYGARKRRRSPTSTITNSPGTHLPLSPYQVHSESLVQACSSVRSAQYSAHAPAVNSSHSSQVNTGQRRRTGLPTPPQSMRGAKTHNAPSAHSSFFQTHGNSQSACVAKSSQASPGFKAVVPPQPRHADTHSECTYHLCYAPIIKQTTFATT